MTLSYRGDLGGAWWQLHILSVPLNFSPHHHCQPLNESKDTKLPFTTWDLIVPSDLTPYLLKEQYLHGAISSVSHIKDTWSTDICSTSLQEHLALMHNDLSLCHIRSTEPCVLHRIASREWNPHI